MRTVAGSPPVSVNGSATPSFIVPLLAWPAAMLPHAGLSPPHGLALRCRCIVMAAGGSVLKLGYKASAEQFGPAELLEFACLAEQGGFDSVFVSDHFQPWNHVGGHAPFSLAWLGALG